MVNLNDDRGFMSIVPEMSKSNRKVEVAVKHVKRLQISNVVGSLDNSKFLSAMLYFKIRELQPLYFINKCLLQS